MRATWLGARSGRSSIFTGPLFNCMMMVFDKDLSSRKPFFSCTNRGAAKAAAGLWRLLAQALLQRAGDCGGRERSDVAAERRDFLDQARGNGLMARIGHQEHGLDLGIEPLIHPDH